MLHDRLEKISMDIKLRKMTENDEDMSVLMSNKEQFKVPLRIIAFISNRIQYFDKNPEAIERY